MRQTCAASPSASPRSIPLTPCPQTHDEAVTDAGFHSWTTCSVPWLIFHEEAVSQWTNESSSPFGMSKISAKSGGRQSRVQLFRNQFKWSMCLRPKFLNSVMETRSDGKIFDSPGWFRPICNLSASISFSWLRSIAFVSYTPGRSVLIRVVVVVSCDSSGRERNKSEPISDQMSTWKVRTGSAAAAAGAREMWKKDVNQSEEWERKLSVREREE